MDGISHNHRVIVSLVSRRDRPFQRGPYLCRYDGTSFRFYRDGGDDCGVFIVDLFLPCSKLLADVQSCRTAGGVVSGWAELR